MKSTNHFNIITFGRRRENLLEAIRKKLIGSSLTTFEKHIHKDSLIFLHCNSLIWGTAKIESAYFFSDIKVWRDKMYPHRFKICDLRLLKTPLALNNGKYNVELRKAAGPTWAYSYIFSPKELPTNIGHLIFEEVQNSDDCSLEEFENIVLSYPTKRKALP